MVNQTIHQISGAEDGGLLYDDRHADWNPAFAVVPVAPVLAEQAVFLAEQIL